MLCRKYTDQPFLYINSAFASFNVRLDLSFLMVSESPIFVVDMLIQSGTLIAFPLLVMARSGQYLALLEHNRIL